MGLQKSGTTDNFAFYYQNRDHLGTVRETVTSTGAMKQRVNYYPFGGQLVDTLKAMVLSPNFQQYKYNGKEFDNMYGLNTYDYGARQHYPVLARWDRIDPLCEKYYGVSPYAYCANNPVKYVDPDGRKIVMSSQNSQEYNNSYKDAISYLKEHGCTETIEFLENIKDEIVIREIGNDKQNYTERSLGTNEIGWKSKEGLLTMDTGYRLSPAIRLFHELAHQEHKLKNPEKFLEDTKPNGSDYYCKDDESVIKNEETTAARNCGEIPNNAVSRESHGGIPYNTSSSTSRDIVNPSEAVEFWIYTWEYKLE